VDELRKFIEGVAAAKGGKAALHAQVGAALFCGNKSGYIFDPRKSVRGPSAIPHRSELQ
jgi:hypothetical protein